jgi:TPR repeat protein
MRIRKLAAILMVVCWLSPAHGQAPVSSTSAVDAGLLAKANSGDVSAQVAVGDCYAEGKAGARDYKQAAEWYTKAADKGDVPAGMHLAALYRDGSKNFPRDMAKAAEWYRKVADQGEPTAQGTLGTLYFLGQGVEQNYVEAYFWLDLAAAVKGPKQAQYAANRQMVGTHITADEIENAKERMAAWKAAHPRPEGAQ